MIADVILPIPIPVYYSYRIPEHLQNNVVKGSRVIVPLGKSKIYTGIVREIHAAETNPQKLKTVLLSPDSQSFVANETMELWEWMAFYYHCTPGEVYKAAVPGYYRNFDDIWASIPKPEKLPKQAGFLGDQLNVNMALQIKHCIQNFGAKKMGEALIALAVENNLQAKYISSVQPREKIICRNVKINEIENHLKSAKKAPARKKILKYFVLHDELPSRLIKEKLAVGKSALKFLYEENILREEDRVVDNQRIQADFSALPELNKAQKIAYQEIKNGFKEKKVCLLHGITSSGKTLIYLHLIQEVINKGKQVIYLLPEIALTSQIITRINESTGGIAEIYHSKFTGKSRLRLWENTQSGQAVLVVGARSSIFLPMKNLGLIIVDEEHDASFKQHDPAPRYNARDMAVMLGNKTGANVLLGSATPSAESWLNAFNGKYHFIPLYSRYQDFPLPKIKILDTYHARKRKVMDGDFHPETLQQIGEVLNRNGQVIVLRNRKGYAPLIRCKTCDWTADCPNCSVHLTYHKKDKKLKCHHCQYSVEMPHKCPECGNTDLAYFGFGTQKVEEELQTLFPDAGISRFDQDSLKSTKQYNRIIQDFTAQKTQILVGTQMLTKGLDFENVRLIVVLHADQMLNYPDFRAFERGYQMLEQVSGRTGRHMDDALVLIQTAFPTHPILTALKAHEFTKMINGELQERRALYYPPFVHLINIHLKSTNPFDLDKRSILLYRDLTREFGKMVSEPATPIVERKGKLHERFIQIKIPKSKNRNQYKRSLHKIVTGFSHSSAGRSLRIYIDADPA
ncbi:MAG: primosomal protein N' [Bacteroidota bacterium]|nr:primosomal protein N' [Bacteroidota bacterium]